MFFQWLVRMAKSHVALVCLYPFMVYSIKIELQTDQNTIHILLTHTVERRNTDVDWCVGFCQDVSFMHICKTWEYLLLHHGVYFEYYTIFVTI